MDIITGARTCDGTRVDGGGGGDACGSGGVVSLHEPVV